MSLYFPGEIALQLGKFIGGGVKFVARKFLVQDSERREKPGHLRGAAVPQRRLTTGRPSKLTRARPHPTARSPPRSRGTEALVRPRCFAAHRAREPVDRAALTVLHAVRDRQVRPSSRGGGSRSADKLDGRWRLGQAAAKPSMHSARVTRSTSSPSANGVRVDHRRSKPGTPARPVHQAGGAMPSAAAALLWDPLAKNVGPPPSRSPSRRSQVVVRRGQRWWQSQ